VRRPPLPSRDALKSIAAGLFVAAALPPWGFWPLAFVGVAIYGSVAETAATGRQRAARGWLFGAAWLFPGMCWMWFLTAPGYLIAAALFAGFHAIAARFSPRGPWRVVGAPVAHTLAEALRFCFPFGGVPLASMAIGQAAGPFLPIVRVGGSLLLTWAVFQIGFALTGPSPYVPLLARKRGATADAAPHGFLGLLVVLVVWLVLPHFASGEFGTEVKTAAPLRVAAVQGGGPQGTHAIDTTADEAACRAAGKPVCTVLERHLQATATIEPGSVDLVVWPEDVVDTAEFAGSTDLALITAEAARIGAPIAVGITEDAYDENHFLNAEVIVTPEGEVVSRYDKVRRVPFGEYMPMRGLLHALGAPTDLVPHDAVAGKGPAVLELPDGTRIATVISWEVFFGGRANDGVAHGGDFILNPTNGSSYTWTVLQSQQIASSRLRAAEQNRWVVQVSPTGFSAFISPDGNVYDRTSVSEQEVIYRAIPRRGWIRTWYSHTGDIPWVALFALVLALALWRSGSGQGSSRFRFWARSVPESGAGATQLPGD
jgi:apolipoprotein N-acyltransferase